MKKDFWNENTEEWTRVVDTQAFASRKVTSPAILELIRNLKAQSILDIGCGEGWLGRAVPEEIRYLGIDGSAGLIEKAKSRSSHSFETVHFGEIENHTWKTDQLFEAIVFNFSLLGEDIQSTLRAVREFLNLEGSILIQTLHPCFQMPKYEDAWFIEDFKTFPVVFKETMPWYGRTLGSWIASFHQSGLRLEKLVEPRAGSAPSSVIFVLKKL